MVSILFRTCFCFDLAQTRFLSKFFDFFIARLSACSSVTRLGAFARNSRGSSPRRGGSSRLFSSFERIEFRSFEIQTNRIRLDFDLNLALWRATGQKPYFYIGLAWKKANLGSIFLVDSIDNLRWIHEIRIETRPKFPSPIESNKKASDHESNRIDRSHPFARSGALARNWRFSGCLSGQNWDWLKMT